MAKEKQNVEPYWSEKLLESYSLDADATAAERRMIMAKYIDRQALIDWLKRIPIKDLSDGLGLCRVIMEDDFKKSIKKMPKSIIADAVPVRHGLWEGYSHSRYCGIDDFGDPIYKDGVVYYCSKCRRKTVIKERYCPNCGAKMDGGAD